MKQFSQNNKIALGVIFIILGILSYQVGSIFAAVLMQQVSLLSAIYLKSVGALILSTLFILIFRINLSNLWRGRKRKYLCLLLIFSVIDSVGWMGSIYYNGLTGSSILAKLIPLTLILYSVIFLKEKLTRLQVFAGVLMIIASLFFSVHAIEFGSIMGLVSQGVLIVGYCGFAIMQKKITDEYDAYSVMWLRAVVIFISTLPLTFFVMAELTTHNLQGFLYLLMLAGVFGFMNGFIKHSFTMKAYNLAPMSLLTFVGEIGAPLSFMAGLFIMNEDMSPSKWIATLVSFTAITVLLIESYSKIGKSNANRT